MRTQREGEHPIMELEVVRSDEARGTTGRPLFLDALRFLRICRLIEHGESASEACRRESVTHPNSRQHVTRSAKYQRRCKQAEQVREHFLREFHISNITKHAAKNVAASMFWLERRYPNEFALKQVTRDCVGAEQQRVCDKISLEE